MGNVRSMLQNAYQHREFVDRTHVAKIADVSQKIMSYNALGSNNGQLLFQVPNFGAKVKTGPGGIRLKSSIGHKGN